MEPDSPSDVFASEPLKSEEATAKISNVEEEVSLLHRRCSCIEEVDPRYLYDDSNVDWRMLGKGAQQRTWDMYKRLKNQGRFVDVAIRLEAQKEKNPDFEIPYDLMEYYYSSGYGIECPYNVLRANRDEYGELMLPNTEDRSEEDFTGYWDGLEKDQQYDMLRQALEERKDLPREHTRKHLPYAEAFVKEHKLNLLGHEVVERCVNNFIYQNAVIKRLDDMRSFGHDLIEGRVQGISLDRRKPSLAKAKRSYPFLDDLVFDAVLDIVFPGGRRRNEKIAREEIEDYYKRCKKNCQRCPTPVGDYIELKLRIAKEIGIIVKGKDGWFVDAFSSAPEDLMRCS